MAATLLSFAAAKAPVLTSRPAPRPRSVVSVGVPLTFILTGLGALALVMAWLVAQPRLLASYHYSQEVIAATHLLVLGWLSTVVMGAMYQLVPVALETSLYSHKLTRWHWVFHVIGVAGMVWMFRAWNMKQVGHFASVFAVGVGLFGYNIARTLVRVPRWNATAASVAAAMGWLSATVVAGLSIAAAKCTYDLPPDTSSIGTLLSGLRAVARAVGQFDPLSAMHAHAHLGAVGFFTMLIVGVSYKLIPMFTLSELQSKRRAALSVILLNVGLAGSLISILRQSPWKLASAMTVVAALLVYGWEIVAILSARKRRALDWGVRSFLTAVGLLLPMSVMATVLSWPGVALTPVIGQLENAYGFIGLIGVVSLAVIGMLYKIIPFLVWSAAYSEQIGYARVPALADLSSPPLQAAGLWTYLAGVLLTTIAILAASEVWVQAGCALLAASVIAFLLNVSLILSHLVRPRLMPLTSSRKKAI